MYQSAAGWPPVRYGRHNCRNGCRANVTVSHAPSPTTPAPLWKQVALQYTHAGLGKHGLSVCLPVFHTRVVGDAIQISHGEPTKRIV